MVVFHYGSVVLFNVSDHEADEYLKIVEKHASGLLPEMRKDGKDNKEVYTWLIYLFFQMYILDFFSSSYKINSLYFHEPREIQNKIAICSFSTS